MRMFEKMAGANTIILVVCVLAVIFLVYSIFGTTTEVYYYHVDDLTENSKLTHMERDATYTNHTHAKLYDRQKNHVGAVSSVNFHQVIDGVNRVTTLTTFTTKRGAIVCHVYYETDLENHYLQGMAADITPEHETGAYKGKKVTLHIDGKPDGDREVTIHTSRKLF